MDFIARNILEKVDQQTKIRIMLLGTADGSTGSMKRNEYLSQKRGEYIQNLLVEKYGISADRLMVESEVKDVEGQPDLGRTVTISF